MKLVLGEPRFFKDSIGIISEMVTEAKFKANKDGLELVAMDQANVAMVVFKLLASCFSEYKVEKQEIICINLASLKQILRRAKADDILSLETTDDSKLTVTMKSNTVRSFSIPTLELDDKEQRVPDLQFQYSLLLPSPMLVDAIDDVSVVGESVTFLGDAKEMLIRAEGDMSKALIEIKPNDVVIISAKGAEKYKSKYSLEYLKKMASGGKLSDQAHVQFSTDYPLRIDYKVTDRLMMSFILAPRVDND